jgi:hypothetical protein
MSQSYKPSTVAAIPEFYQGLEIDSTVLVSRNTDSLPGALAVRVGTGTL